MTIDTCIDAGSHHHKKSRKFCISPKIPSCYSFMVTQPTTIKSQQPLIYSLQKCHINPAIDRNLLETGFYTQHNTFGIHYICCVHFYCCVAFHYMDCLKFIYSPVVRYFCSFQFLMSRNKIS